MEVTDVRYGDAIAFRRRYRCRGLRVAIDKDAVRVDPVLIWIEAFAGPASIFD
ncbi:hypothetical protein [Bradyrhizobium sp. USDA 4451]